MFKSAIKFLPLVAAIATVQGASLRKTQQVWPQCDEIQPTEASFLAHLPDYDIALSYCLDECYNTGEFCVTWLTNHPGLPIQWPQCNEILPSAESFQAHLPGYNEARDYCLGECMNTAQFCDTWLTNHPENQGNYPQCDEIQPSAASFEAHLPGFIHARDYCLGECMNSADFCATWLTNHPMKAPYMECVMDVKTGGAQNKCSNGSSAHFPGDGTIAVFPIIGGERPLADDPFLCCKVSQYTDVSKCYMAPNNQFEIGCRGNAGYAVRSVSLFGDDIARCCDPLHLQV